jgi:hypothetical protein
VAAEGLAPKQISHLQRLVSNPGEPPAQATQPIECDANCAHHRPVRLSWAKLLKRVFDLDLEHCPNCGGDLKIIAAIVEAPVIEKILTTWVCRPGHSLGRQPVARRCKPSPDANSPVNCWCLARGRATGPTRPASGLTIADSSPFRWPAEQGYGDRLRARVFGTDGCGAAPRANT